MMLVWGALACMASGPSHFSQGFRHGPVLNEKGLKHGLKKGDYLLTGVRHNYHLCEGAIRNNGGVPGWPGFGEAGVPTHFSRRGTYCIYQVLSIFYSLNYQTMETLNSFAQGYISAADAREILDADATCIGVFVNMQTDDITRETTMEIIARGAKGEQLFGKTLTLCPTPCPTKPGKGG
jgi:hypothetical protein